MDGKEVSMELSGLISLRPVGLAVTFRGMGGNIFPHEDTLRRSQPSLTANSCQADPGESPISQC